MDLMAKSASLSRLLLHESALDEVASSIGKSQELAREGCCCYCQARFGELSRLNWVRGEMSFSNTFGVRDISGSLKPLPGWLV